MHIVSAGGDLPAVIATWPKEQRPAILVSFWYLKQHLAALARTGERAWREWCFDSGAFTAAQKGKSIAVEDFAAAAVDMIQCDEPPTEVFTLDVIGGHWKESARNTRYLWDRGIPAIPIFHFGEPEDVLLGYAREYPKIALGGKVGLPEARSIPWALQCMARVWPKRVHGLGYGTRKALMQIPFHSCDASTWASASRFGYWTAFNHARLGLRGVGDFSRLGPRALAAEIAAHLRVERDVQSRWKREMALLEQAEVARCVPAS